MSPFYSNFSMFHETWGDKKNGGAFRGQKSSELFWTHGTDHQTFTTEGANNRLMEHATVDHGVCCLVSFDSGKRKVARLKSDTKFIFKDQIPHELLQVPGIIPALSDRGIIVIDGFSEIHNAQAFEHDLRVSSYRYEDGTSVLEEYPKWPSAKEMANYGYVFEKILNYGEDTYVYMRSIWQSELLTGFKRKREDIFHDVIHFNDASFIEENNFMKAVVPMKKNDSKSLTMEHIYSNSCRFANVDKQQYLAELRAASSEPVLKLNRGLLNNGTLKPVPALRSVVQTEDSSLPAMQLIVPAGSGGSVPRYGNPGSYFATLKFAGAALRHLALRR